ncbi:MAG: methyltransferase domain-containing protein [Flavobacteriaceae bacterium]
MRLHRNLVLAVIDALNYIFNDGLLASKVVETTLKRDKRWGSHDRKFLAETIYEIVRWRRLYSEIAGTKEHFTKENLWKIFTVWAVLKGYKLPDWKQFVGVPERRIKGGFAEAQNTRKIRESIPDWLDDLGVKELGAKWDAELKALNQPAQVVLRVNTLKISKLALKKQLSSEGIETKLLSNYPDALVLKERQNVFISDAFKNGFFEVQDANSQKVAAFLNAKPGMRVVDACAGAGGKTLHLASILENKGQLIALDIYKNKLSELKRRAKRDGAFNIEPRLIDSNKVIKKLHNSADRLLLDSPCSGLGVLKRNPDAKWKLQPEFLDKIRATQQEILENYSKIIKVNGQMVYATCSVLPSENKQQVAIFLKNNDNFRLLNEEHLCPHKTGFDGFYMALIERIK